MESVQNLRDHQEAEGQQEDRDIHEKHPLQEDEV